MSPAREKTVPDLSLILSKPLNLAILEALAGGPLALGDLSCRVGRSKSQVCTYVADLCRTGCVRKLGRCRKTRYALGRRPLARLLRTFRDVQAELATPGRAEPESPDRPAAPA